MSSLEEIREVRLEKLKRLRDAGINPYPAKVPRDLGIGDLKNNFNQYKDNSKEISIAGRVMAIRGQGAILFAVLYDDTGKFQVIFKKDAMPEDMFDLFVNTSDIGDFISVTGVPMTSERGEPSVMVKSWVMASKSLLPLPDKWDGLQDVEERYRKRYLDLIMNEDLRTLLKKKSLFWDVTRNFFKERDFLEVETPTLELTTGGAEARPFKTHHNDFDLDLYLRISVGELWQKRLIAGGLLKTFEVGRVYRNEGSSPEHTQEFTNMEFYWAYADYNDGMRLVEDLYRKIALDVFGTTKFTSHGHTFDLSDKWEEIDYVSEIKKQTGLDIDTVNEKEIKDKLQELRIEYEGDNKERLIDTLWKFCRKNISGPAFLINHPTIVAPLAKKIAGKEVTQMFQPIIAGSEVGRGYSELNDPMDQRKRFEEQQKLSEAGDEEAMMADWEFVEMLEHAMPPTCGFGFGERLFAILADRPLRELQAFPLLRPKE